VPWCTTCDRFLSPSTVRSDGTCPACGRDVDPGRAHAPQPVAVDGAPPPVAADGVVPAVLDDADERVPIPWHLWMLLAALAVYLGYRAFQGLQWVFGF
jgi:hypothetical protein